MNTIDVLGKYFRKYITITGFSGSTYTYKARSKNLFPVVNHVLRIEKCKPGSWLYVALDSVANIEYIKNLTNYMSGRKLRIECFEVTD